MVPYQEWIEAYDMKDDAIGGMLYGSAHECLYT